MDGLPIDALDKRTRTRIGAHLCSAEAHFSSNQARRLHQALGDGIGNPIFRDVEKWMAEERGIQLSELGYEFAGVANSDLADVELLFAVSLAAVAVDQLASDSPYMFTMTGAELRRRVNVALEEAGSLHRVEPTGVGTVSFAGELSQKFGILGSPGQISTDFDRFKGIGADVAVLFFDIDHFKALNTEFTESIVDDTILRPFQQSVRAMVAHRGGAYHVGGDEFMILLANVTREEAGAFANRLLSEVRGWTFRAPTRTVRLTITVGVACRGGDPRSFEDLKVAANKAESVAKRKGRNCVSTESNDA